MIRFKAQSVEEGRTVYGLGLTHTNVARLTGGEPMQIRMEDMGGPPGVTLFLFYGETEAAMQQAFADGKLAGSLTKVIRDPRPQDPDQEHANPCAPASWPTGTGGAGRG